MVEVDPLTPLTGADGSVPLIDIFDGRSQLIAYYHMWHTGRPTAEQCEGCTFNTSHINEPGYLHSRDVSCRCGIYAAVAGTLDSLPGYLLDTAYDDDLWAYAEIACSGRVFVDMRGVRAERAEIVRIALPDSCWPDEVALDTAKRMLRERYGVPVNGLDSVPDWVTGNRREAGLRRLRAVDFARCRRGIDARVNGYTTPLPPGFLEK
jgi:hypothetical protein